VLFDVGRQRLVQVRRDRDRAHAGGLAGIASTMTSCSARVAGRMVMLRLTTPAPGMRHGLAMITSSATAARMIVRSSE
jgi:hypothetical protein